MSIATRTEYERKLRRKRSAATGTFAARTVRDLMAELQEAEIRARIKSARRQAGLSQVQMAELLEVIPRTVQNYENDHVPWARLKDIAEIAGVSTRWLLHGDEDTEASPGPEAPNQLDRIEERLSELEAVLRKMDVGASRAIEKVMGTLRGLDQGREPGSSGSADREDPPGEAPEAAG